MSLSPHIQSASLGLISGVIFKLDSFYERARSIPKLLAQMQVGPWIGRKEALAGLIAAGAEDVLTDCLNSPDPLTSKLATAGLWECWMNEEGPEARATLEGAMELMEQEEWSRSQTVLRDLSLEYPGWAEPVHKRGCLFYHLGMPAKALELFDWVVELKPNHFGAWHGLAQSALELRRWKMAVRSAKKALRIHPFDNANANREIIRMARANLPEIR